MTREEVDTPEMQASARRVLAAATVAATTPAPLSIGPEPFLDLCRDWLIDREDPRWDGRCITDPVRVMIEVCEWLMEPSQP